MTHRLRYIYEFQDVLEQVTEIAEQRTDWIGEPRFLAMGAIRGLLEHAFHLALLPDHWLPYVHRDAWNIEGLKPVLMARIRRQIRIPPELQEEWVKIIFHYPNADTCDLFLEYDFGPRDVSVHFEDSPYASDFSPQRSRMRARGTL